MHEEVVFLYDSSGDTMVTDETNMGTYKFFSPNGFTAWNHIKYDVDPYIEWGNGTMDVSTIEQRSVKTRAGLIEASK